MSVADLTPAQRVVVERAIAEAQLSAALRVITTRIFRVVGVKAGIAQLEAAPRPHTRLEAAVLARLLAIDALLEEPCP